MLLQVGCGLPWRWDFGNRDCIPTRAHDCLSDRAYGFLPNRLYDRLSDGLYTRISKIAFESSRDGNIEIYTMNADGSNQTRLTTNDAVDSSPVWSP